MSLTPLSARSIDFCTLLGVKKTICLDGEKKKMSGFRITPN